MPLPPRPLLLALLGLPLLACDAPSSSGPAASAVPAKEDVPVVKAPAPTASAVDHAPQATPPPTATAAAEQPAPPDVAAPPADAKKTASGLAYKVLTPGKGKDHPKQDDRVLVRYTGWTKAGKMFDASEPDKPTSFRVSEVVKGWTEALKLMVAGEKLRVWVPAKLAYGDQPQMMGAPTGDLVFDIELVDIPPPIKPPPVPKDVKAPPKDATTTASGLAYKLLKEGTGPQKPKETDNVVVNYSGWTTDGKMFDSSVTSGEPITFPLNHVIKGWTEGLSLMKVGDVMRFWIPAKLAYGDKPAAGRPAGMLVFDIELVGIK